MGWRKRMKSRGGRNILYYREWSSGLKVMGGSLTIAEGNQVRNNLNGKHRKAYQLGCGAASSPYQQSLGGQHQTPQLTRRSETILPATSLLLLAEALRYLSSLTSDRNREGKSKTLHLTDSGSNFKQVARGTRPQAATMQPVIEQPKQRTLTNTKSAAALKTVQNAKPIAGNTPVPVKKTVGKDKKHVKDNKETKESKEIKDNKENKTTGKAHHSSILPNKTTEPEPVIHAPEQQVDAVVDFVIPEIEVPK
jgi:hypothetical protein